jgi:cold shock CspA family protein
MYRGNITRLFHDKEYGSIKAKSGEDVHFHKYCLWNVQFDELFDGQEVEFEMQATHKGFIGFQIRPCVR